jgi:hypothetical protein
MCRTYRRGPFVCLLAIALATSLFGRGQSWDFLGCAAIDGNQDHGTIQVARRDCVFHTIQVRVSGEPIFFDRFVVHFVNGTTQDLIVSGRISSEGRTYTVSLHGERRVLESVELWYYKEPWGHSPRVSLYGIRFADPDNESIAREN